MHNSIHISAQTVQT